MWVVAATRRRRRRAARSGAAADAAKALLPLSRMKKGDLVAECESRGLENGGTVAELRARIRIERRQDALVAQLVDRGWSDRRARAR